MQPLKDRKSRSPPQKSGTTTAPPFWKGYIFSVCIQNNYFSSRRSRILTSVMTFWS